jgi:hypothetical protein
MGLLKLIDGIKLHSKRVENLKNYTQKGWRT